MNMKYLYDELCAAVDNYEFVIHNPHEDEVTRTIEVVRSKDMYERLKYHFSRLRLTLDKPQKI